jgi:hypothetical protein
MKYVVDVRYWPKADIPRCTAHVRFWRQSGHGFAASAHSGHPQLHRTCPLLGAKWTCLFAVRMSAFDPKRTWASALQMTVWYP